MTTETIDDLKRDLVAHDKNVSEGVAHIDQFTDQPYREDVDAIAVQFALPYGDETFRCKVPNTDETWDTLYAATDANPPCIDDLPGEPVPVEWDEGAAEWSLDIDIDGADEESTDSSSAGWARGMTFPFGVALIVSIWVAGAAGAAQGWGPALGATAAVAIWLLVLWGSFPPLYKLWVGDYEWVID